METISIAVAGFSAVSAVLLFFTYALLLDVQRQVGLLDDLVRAAPGSAGLHSGRSPAVLRRRSATARVYLAKTITRIVPGKRIDFDITEQTIRYHERIVLRGGTIEIEARADGNCSVRMLTHYELRFPTSFVGRFFVDLVVSAMHRIVIRDMQAALARPEASGSKSQLPQAARSMPDRIHTASPSAYARRYR